MLATGGKAASKTPMRVVCGLAGTKCGSGIGVSIVARSANAQC
jgi:hypothetical protein